MTSLSPPWILFTDRGKPVAILPAGRPGEVANIEGMSMETAMRIVNAANEPIRDAHMQLAEVSKRILEIHDEITRKSEEPAKKRKRFEP
jgi:hypothetical protein